MHRQVLCSLACVLALHMLLCATLVRVHAVPGVYDEARLQRQTCSTGCVAGILVAAGMIATVATSLVCCATWHAPEFRQRIARRAAACKALQLRMQDAAGGGSEAHTADGRLVAVADTHDRGGDKTAATHDDAHKKTTTAAASAAHKSAHTSSHHDVDDHKSVAADAAHKSAHTSSHHDGDDHKSVAADATHKSAHTSSHHDDNDHKSVAADAAHKSAHTSSHHGDDHKSEAAAADASRHHDDKTVASEATKSARSNVATATSGGASERLRDAQQAATSSS